MSGTYNEYESFKRAAFALSAAFADYIADEDGRDLDKVDALLEIYLAAREAWTVAELEVGTL